MKLNALFFLLIVLVPCSLFSNTLYFPQVAFGGGYTTTFVIMIMGTTNVSSRVNFYDQRGGSLAASSPINVPVGGSIRFTLPDTEPFTVAWGELAAGLGNILTHKIRGHSCLLSACGSSG